MGNEQQVTVCPTCGRQVSGQMRCIVVSQGQGQAPLSVSVCLECWAVRVPMKGQTLPARRMAPAVQQPEPVGELAGLPLFAGLEG